MKIKSLPAFAAVALGIVVAGCWYFSPYLMIYQMKAAAQRQDAASFNAYVDYPRVRESVKAQFGSLINDRVQIAGQDIPVIASMGQAMGMMIASKMVDTLVQPETVMKVMQEGRFGVKPAVRSGDDAGTMSQEASSGRGPGDRAWVLDRLGADKAIAYPVSSNDPQNLTHQRVSVVIERRGFADWQLTEVRLPEGMLK